LPGIIDRARYLMFGEMPRKARAISTALNPIARILLLLAGKQPVWTGEDYAALSEAGYVNCMAVYACVRLIAETSAGITWKTKDRRGRNVEDHAMLRLLARPNDRDGQRSFVAGYFSFRLLAGNSYIIAGRIGKQPPLALWLPRPDRMKVIPGTAGNVVGGYRYEVGSDKQDLEPGNVMHSRMFHPTNDWYGLSPLRAASKGVDISNMAQEWNARVLTNDMRPPGALATDSKLDETGFDRLRAMIKQDWQGYDNIGNPLILEQGLKWIPFAMNPKDMDWLNSTKITRRDICAVYNVDPCLVGDSEFATYSNKVEAGKGLYRDNVIPAMHEFRDELNRWLAPMFGDEVVLDIDRDKIEALAEDREKKFAYIAQADWLSVNEKRAATGFEPLGEAGEVVLVPIGKIPLEGVGMNILPGAAESASKTAAPEKKILWGTPERKEALWRNFVARVEAKERGIIGLAKNFLQLQAKQIGEAARKSGLGASPSQLVDIRREAADFYDATRVWYADSAGRAIRAGLQSAKGELPELEGKAMPPKLTTAQWRKLSDMILYSGTKIATATMEMVRDIRLLAEAERWTVEQYVQNLILKLENFSQFRCRTIGRTETTKVENWGELEGYRETGYVDKKGWMCSFVPASRDSHMAADGQEVGVDEDFVVGSDRMAFPGDPRGGAGEVVNCLCALYPVARG
jgi:HK97 family phage portal protein